MASESVTRLYAKLKEMNLSIGGMSFGELKERAITSDHVADELYDSLVRMQQGDVEVIDDGTGSEGVTARFKEKYSYLDAKLLATKPKPSA